MGDRLGRALVTLHVVRVDWLYVHDREKRHSHPHHEHEEEERVADVPCGISDYADNKRYQEGARLDSYWLVSPTNMT